MRPGHCFYILSDWRVGDFPVQLENSQPNGLDLFGFSVEDARRCFPGPSSTKHGYFVTLNPNPTKTLNPKTPKP